MKKTNGTVQDRPNQKVDPTEPLACTNFWLKTNSSQQQTRFTDVNIMIPKLYDSYCITEAATCLK